LLLESVSLKDSTLSEIKEFRAAVHTAVRGIYGAGSSIPERSCNIKFKYRRDYDAGKCLFTFPDGEAFSPSHMQFRN
jgi:hypothetical protein